MKMDKGRQVARELALQRPELREPAPPSHHTPSSGPTSRAVRLRDPKFVEMVDRFMAHREAGSLPPKGERQGGGNGSAPAVEPPPTPNPTPQGGRDGPDINVGTTEIPGYVVVDETAGLCIALMPTFHEDPEEAVREFFDMQCDDVGRREVDTMGGRYKVRGARLTIMGAYQWPKGAQS